MRRTLARPSHALVAALLGPVAIAIPTGLVAQSAMAVAPAGPRVGILAGLSSATISGSDFAVDANTSGIAKKRQNGVVAGVYLTLPLAGSPISLRPELLYVQKGAKVTGNFDFVDFPTDARSVSSVKGPPAAQAVIPNSFAVATKLDYLELPVLLQFDIPPSAGLRPALYAGPSIAYRVRCNVEATFGGSTQSSACDDASSGNDASGLRKVDVSGIVGGQLGFALAGQTVGVGVRYTYGFTNIAKDADAKNRALGVYASIEFPFGR